MMKSTQVNPDRISRMTTLTAAASLVAGSLALGMDLALSHIHRIGIHPVELGEIETSQIPSLIMGISLAGTVWMILSITTAGLTKTGWRRAMIETAHCMTPLLILCLRCIEERYLMNSPAPMLRIIAWLCVGVLYWRMLTVRFEYRIRKRIGRQAIAGLVLLTGSIWAAGGFGPRRHPVGDEPAYLMIAHSLAQDGDINMNDDYHHRVYRLFYSGPYPMFTHLGYDGFNYPHHSIGLPLLLTPMYRLILTLGMDQWLVLIMRLCIVVIYTLCAVLTRELIHRLTGNRNAATWCIAAFFLSGPMLFYSTEIYPEILSALLLVGSMHIGLFPPARSAPLRYFWVGASAAFLPWLGIKYIPTGLMLIAITILMVRQHKSRFIRSLTALGLPVFLSGVVYAWFLYAHYRNFNPSVIYTGVIPGTGTPNILPGEPGFFEALPIHLNFIPRFVWGILIDQRIGILIMAPLYLLFLPGLIEGFRRRRLETAVLLILIGTHIGIYAWHNNWGGYCAPNRQFIAVGPLVATICGWGWISVSSAIGTAFRRIAVFWGWTAAWLLLVHERWLYHTMNPHLMGGESNMLRAFSPDYSLDLTTLFPLIMGNIQHSRVNWIWTIAFLAAAAFLFTGSPSRSGNKLFTPKTSLILLAVLLSTGMFICWYLPPLDDYHLVDFPDQTVRRMIILDRNHLGMEPDGFWVKGRSAARMLVAFSKPHTELGFDLYSLIPGPVTVDLGGRNRVIEMDGKYHAVFPMEPRRIFPRGDLFYSKLRIHAAEGISPGKAAGAEDTRFLGVFVSLK
ncbi:hypothetical protein JXA40_03215 [bacterium]|nr:hypothetical protein [candidate division CSSED10-310 bacterium]